METKPLEPLHINSDGLWALTVALSDQSYECLKCFVSHKFLAELIGWTPDEALVSFFENLNILPPKFECFVPRLILIDIYPSLVYLLFIMLTESILITIKFFFGKFDSRGF